MTGAIWTSWPSREALSAGNRTRPRALIAWSVRVVLLTVMLWGAFTSGRFGPWEVALGLVGVAGCAVAAWAFFRTSLEHRPWPSLALLALLMVAALGAQQAGARVPAVILWCGCAVSALERLPLAAGLPATAVALGAYAAVDTGGWLNTAITTGGLCLAGYVLRLDAEARGSAQRLLVQERAARAAEAETAAPDERARIAREIHDVLAHSLSAQLVHLEATRLLIEREPAGGSGTGYWSGWWWHVPWHVRRSRRPVTRSRRSGGGVPGGGFPTAVGGRGARRGQRDGEQRTLTAEASQTVRRVAQEAVTNVRKHAPGARVLVRLEYLPDEVALEVTDSGGRGPEEELAVSGSGYGLLGMRERAELLGGTLEAGPGEEGFVVTLRVPA